MSLDKKPQKASKASLPALTNGAGNQTRLHQTLSPSNQWRGGAVLEDDRRRCITRNMV